MLSKNWTFLQMCLFSNQASPPSVQRGIFIELYHLKWFNGPLHDRSGFASFSRAVDFQLYVLFKRYPSFQILGKGAQECYRTGVLHWNYLDCFHLHHHLCGLSPWAFLNWNVEQ